MTNIEFSKWLAQEEKRIARLSATKSNPSFLVKKKLALEVLHKLDTSSKVDNFKSIIRFENYYRITRG